MRVLFATSEIVPFSKTGGLADVSHAIPTYLAKAGIEVDVFSPMYRSVKDTTRAEDLGMEVVVRVFRRKQRAFLRRAKLPGTQVDVYFVEHDQYFYRPGLYGDERGAFRDNAERFIFFCKVVLEFAKKLEKNYDVVHANEWQTAMLPVYLKTLYEESFPETASVLSLHNIAYQGVFDQWDFNFTGLPWDYFNWKYFEFYGKMNLLKGGIVFADKLNTVSPTYAKEIQTKEFGCGLEEPLSHRSADIVGILNGCEYERWNPRDDELIPANYDVDDLSGKAVCKEELQKLSEFDVSPEVPLIGIVSRLAEQKGFDILEGALQRIFDIGAQLVVLGTGDKSYEEMLLAAQQRNPKSIRVFIKFDERLAHIIEAGADMFLMPSRYEPCGLNQMYSMRYGTIPVVRRTGGLADTVKDAAEEDGTGFVFNDYTPDALFGAVKRAVLAFKDPARWRRIVENAMKERFLWEDSIKRYIELYGSAIQKKKGG